MFQKFVQIYMEMQLLAQYFWMKLVKENVQQLQIKFHVIQLLVKWMLLLKIKVNVIASFLMEVADGRIQDVIVKLFHVINIEEQQLNVQVM